MNPKQTHTPDRSQVEPLDPDKLVLAIKAAREESVLLTSKLYSLNDMLEKMKNAKANLMLLLGKGDRIGAELMFGAIIKLMEYRQRDYVAHKRQAMSLFNDLLMQFADHTRISIAVKTASAEPSE